GDALVGVLHPPEQALEVLGHQLPIAGVRERLDPLDVQIVEGPLARGVDVHGATRGAAHEANPRAVEEVARPVRLARRAVDEAVVRTCGPDRRAGPELEGADRAIRPGHRAFPGGFWRSLTKGFASRNASVSTMLS